MFAWLSSDWLFRGVAYATHPLIRWVVLALLLAVAALAYGGRPGDGHCPCGVDCDCRSGCECDCEAEGVPAAPLRLEQPALHPETHPMPELPCLDFAEAATKIKNGDLLLFARHSPISIYGRGKFSHAAMAGWWQNQLMCLEQREFRGGRAVKLASQVRKFPGAIHVYRPDVPERDRDRALREMIHKLGRPYGYRSIAKCCFLHLPGLARLYRELSDGPPARKNGGDWAEHCSGAFASAWRSAGWDPVPNLPDWATEPNDLARSDRFASNLICVLR